MLLNFNVVHFPFNCYVDMALNVPVKILYNTHCYNQNIDPVVLKDVRAKIFLR